MEWEVDIIIIGYISTVSSHQVLKLTELDLLLMLLGSLWQRLGMFGPLRCGEMYALDRLLLEARILEMVRRAAKESPRALSRPEEGN